MFEKVAYIFLKKAYIIYKNLYFDFAWKKHYVELYFTCGNVFVSNNFLCFRKKCHRYNLSPQINLEINHYYFKLFSQIIL